MTKISGQRQGVTNTGGLLLGEVRYIEPQVTAFYGFDTLIFYSARVVLSQQRYGLIKLIIKLLEKFERKNDWFFTFSRLRRKVFNKKWGIIR